MTSSSSSPHAVYRALERAIAYAIADEQALLAARDDWTALAGKVHDDEPLYEERAAAFLEWFALERRAPGPPAHALSVSGGPAPLPPIERLIAEQTAAGGEPADLAANVALAASHRSVFRVREASGARMLLDDLWGGGVFLVKERRHLAGVERGEIFDARLVADVESPPDLLLTRIVCVHPREAEQAVRKQIDRARREGVDRAALLFLLLRLRVRCERYQHVTPARIYAAGETFRPGV